MKPTKEHYYLSLTMIVFCFVSSLHAEYELTWTSPYSQTQSSTDGKYKLVTGAANNLLPDVSGSGYLLRGQLKQGSSGCIVNLNDLVDFLEEWLLTASDLNADYNGDGTVNLGDLAVLSSCWLEECPDIIVFY
jgi:hypothetical protein